ncbi:hypothetical protein K788_0000733 [Paraburkholderia caribensis MBA4]|uniref:Uncharacterized protein n=1 Tax=Paraburkholderia caribensis MBA4 TaxID=1323664 RepID=A0A0P0RHR1_9BURK|nr:hypothetical protein K788_0000733 [Paraburkholderia caribensis MBA4]
MAGIAAHHAAQRPVIVGFSFIGNIRFFELKFDMSNNSKR